MVKQNQTSNKVQKVENSKTKNKNELNIKIKNKDKDKDKDKDIDNNHDPNLESQYEILHQSISHISPTSSYCNVNSAEVPSLHSTDNLKNYIHLQLPQISIEKPSSSSSVTDYTDSSSSIYDSDSSDSPQTLPSSSSYYGPLIEEEHSSTSPDSSMIILKMPRIEFKEPTINSEVESVTVRRPLYTLNKNAFSSSHPLRNINDNDTLILASIRQTMSSSPFISSFPLKFFFVGPILANNILVLDKIVKKIQSALKVASSSNQNPVFRHVVATEFNQSQKDACTLKVSKPFSFISDYIDSETISNNASISLSLDQTNLNLSLEQKLPHIAIIFYPSELEDNSFLKANREAAIYFFEKANIPVLTICANPEFASDPAKFLVSTNFMHICVEILHKPFYDKALQHNPLFYFKESSATNAFGSIATSPFSLSSSFSKPIVHARLPIDFSTFISLDSTQINKCFSHAYDSTNNSSSVSDITLTSSTVTNSWMQNSLSFSTPKIKTEDEQTFSMENIQTENNFSQTETLNVFVFILFKIFSTFFSTLEALPHFIKLSYNKLNYISSTNIFRNLVWLFSCFIAFIILPSCTFWLFKDFFLKFDGYPSVFSTDSNPLSSILYNSSGTKALLNNSNYNAVSEVIDNHYSMDNVVTSKVSEETLNCKTASLKTTTGNYNNEKILQSDFPHNCYITRVVSQVIRKGIIRSFGSSPYYSDEYLYSEKIITESFPIFTDIFKVGSFEIINIDHNNIMFVQNLDKFSNEYPIEAKVFELDNCGKIKKFISSELSQISYSNVDDSSVGRIFNLKISLPPEFSNRIAIILNTVTYTHMKLTDSVNQNVFAQNFFESVSLNDELNESIPRNFNFLHNFTFSIVIPPLFKEQSLKITSQNSNANSLSNCISSKDSGFTNCSTAWQNKDFLRSPLEIGNIELFFVLNGEKIPESLEHDSLSLDIRTFGKLLASQKFNSIFFSDIILNLNEILDQFNNTKLNENTHVQLIIWIAPFSQEYVNEDRHGLNTKYKTDVFVPYIYNISFSSSALESFNDARRRMSNNSNEKMGFNHTNNKSIELSSFDVWSVIYNTLTSQFDYLNVNKLYNTTTELFRSILSFTVESMDEFQYYYSNNISPKISALESLAQSAINYTQIKALEIMKFARNFTFFNSIFKKSNDSTSDSFFTNSSTVNDSIPLHNICYYDIFNKLKKDFTDTVIDPILNVKLNTEDAKMKLNSINNEITNFITKYNFTSFFIKENNEEKVLNSDYIDVASRNAKKLYDQGVSNMQHNFFPLMKKAQSQAVEMKNSLSDMVASQSAEYKKKGYLVNIFGYNI